MKWKSKGYVQCICSEGSLRSTNWLQIILQNVLETRNAVMPAKK